MADDEVSTECFLKHVLFNIKNNKSLIMIDERQELEEEQQEKEEEKQEGAYAYFSINEITLLFSF